MTYPAHTIDCIEVSCQYYDIDDHAIVPLQDAEDIGAIRRSLIVHGYMDQEPHRWQVEVKTGPDRHDVRVGKGSTPAAAIAEALSDD